MCLLDAVVGWSATAITCRASSHLSPDNPLRRAGRLAGVCGIEYGLQAAALHGALSSGSKQPPGYLAALRDVEIRAERLDDPSLGELHVTATQEMQSPGGLIYRFVVGSSAGTDLLSGRATIVLPPAP